MLDFNSSAPLWLKITARTWSINACSLLDIDLLVLIDLQELTNARELCAEMKLRHYAQGQMQLPR